MQQNKIEEFAFLYLCGEDDRNLLLGNVSLSFEDFDRLTYLANHFGLQEYGAELWNRYGRAFHQQYELLGALSSGADCDAILRSVMDPEQDKNEEKKVDKENEQSQDINAEQKVFAGVSAYDKDVAMHEKWISDFCTNAPTAETRKFLQKLDRDLCTVE